MKYLIIALLFFCNISFADECKTTTVTVEHTDGKVETESATVCKDGQTVAPKVKIGDVILESELPKAKVRKYFNYKNSRCRMFAEHVAENKQLKEYYGVICQLDDSENWIVVDKW